MDNCLFSKVKNSKAFKKRDLFIYLIAILVVATAFLCVFFIGNNGASGFNVSLNNKTILTYDFNANTYTAISSKDFTLSVNEDVNAITFTIKSGDNFDRVNVILVDKLNKSVKVKDANCPNGDCKTFSPLSVNKAGVIYCATHGLQISSVGDGYRPPVSGD